MNQEQKDKILALFPDARSVNFSVTPEWTTQILDNHGCRLGTIAGNPYKLDHLETVSLVDPHDQFTDRPITEIKNEKQWDQVHDVFGNFGMSYCSGDYIMYKKEGIAYGIVATLQDRHPDLKPLPYPEFCKLAGLEEIKSTRRMTAEELADKNWLKVDTYADAYKPIWYDFQNDMLVFFAIGDIAVSRITGWKDKLSDDWQPVEVEIN